MKLLRRYRFRLYPSAEQAARLRQWEGALRWLWNLALEQRLNDLRRCKVDRTYPSHLSQAHELTELRRDLPWLADVPRDACGEVLKALDLGWRQCFARRGGRPCFKAKGADAMSVGESHGNRLRITGGPRDGALVFPRLGTVRLVVHRPVDGIIKCGAIVRDGDQWFVSVVVERGVPDPAPSALPAVGIDRGVALLLATSDGRTVSNPRFREKLQPRVARAQRAVARKKKGSKNRQKARVKAARLQRKARRQREHFLHDLSLDLAKSHGTVVMEKLNVKEMTASAAGTVEEPGTNVRQKAGLNRGIMDAGWTRFAG